jgi:hypothetical protein
MLSIAFKEWAVICRALAEGRSCLSGKEGQQVAAPAISIWDDAADPATLGIGFDFEGVPRRRVDLIRDGVFIDGVYDMRTAKQTGKTSTGHALPSPNPEGPFPLNLFMATGDASLEDMIAATDHGVLVTRFHYTNPVTHLPVQYPPGITATFGGSNSNEGPSSLAALPSPPKNVKEFAALDFAWTLPQFQALHQWGKDEVFDAIAQHRKALEMMRFTLPAAIGAKMGAPDRMVICLVGDGGLMSVVGALTTAVELGVPVVWVLFNNFCFSTIRTVGTTYFNNTYGTEFTTPDGAPYNPNFVQLAHSFGMQAACVEEPDEIAAALKKAFGANVPYLLEVRTRADVPMPRTGYWDIADFLVGGNDSVPR